MPRRISAAVARPARTAGQGGLGFAVMAVIQSFHHFTPEQYGALLLLFTIVFGWAQVLIENRLGKGILREVPPKTEPIVDSNDSDGASGGIKAENIPRRAVAPRKTTSSGRRARRGKTSE